MKILKLKKLERLELWNFQFDSIPNEISKLQNLEYLYLGGRKLIKLPYNNIVKMKSLKSIELFGTLLAKNEFIYYKKHKHYNQLQIIADSLPNCRIVLSPRRPW